MRSRESCSFCNSGKYSSKGFKGWRRPDASGRRHPLKPRWAEQLAASMKDKISGPHESVKF